MHRGDRERIFTVDVHTHILPESWPDLKERYGYGGWVSAPRPRLTLHTMRARNGARLASLRFQQRATQVVLEHSTTCAGPARMFKDDGTPFRDVDDNLWSLDRRLRDCDGVGVDVHVRVCSTTLCLSGNYRCAHAPRAPNPHKTRRSSRLCPSCFRIGRSPRTASTCARC